jgi:hypothetical protein
VSALTARGQALLVPRTAVAAEVHQPLDVELRVAPEVTLDAVVGLDRVADLPDGVLVEGVGALVGRDTRVAQDDVGRVPAETNDLRESDLDPLVAGEVDTSDAGHVRLSCCRQFAGRSTLVYGAPASLPKGANSPDFINSCRFRRSDRKTAGVGKTCSVGLKTPAATPDPPSRAGIALKRFQLLTGIKGFQLRSSTSENAHFAACFNAREPRRSPRQLAGLLPCHRRSSTRPFSRNSR